MSRDLPECNNYKEKRARESKVKRWQNKDSGGEFLEASQAGALGIQMVACHVPEGEAI